MAGVRTHFDPVLMDPDRVYQLLTATVVPRPIAWVSTRSAAGVDNLAPYSFFTIASTRPPIVQFCSVGHKDSVRNVAETGEFVVNLASQPMLDQVNASAAAFGAGESEFDKLDIALEPSVRVAPPRVLHAPVSVECVRERIIEIGDSYLVLGRVVFVTVNSRALDEDGLPASQALAPLSRLGGTEWGVGMDTREVPRPAPPAAG
ncbi:flavin reductase family protein [Hoyosella sp. G463]|uniref:Flavin reductase family protein n=1 Tax=Lolliginicoccus lacisalsi TaxID=2742202 RepID=A0A927JDP6_9ACTN|nr:flavin reductase family protein [Lolliginicoccus lacisalsi]MBD8507344.1 flavin reductase family protein [Lolliginicoccus lacisalsi]